MTTPDHAAGTGRRRPECPRRHGHRDRPARRHRPRPRRPGRRPPHARSWAATSSGRGATARATACTTPTAGPTSTSPTGSRSASWATATRAVTAAIHAQVDRLIAPMAAMGYAESTVRLAGALAATLPDPIDSIFFMNSGSRGDRGGPQAGAPGHRPARDHRLPGRLPRADDRGAASITSSNINYRAGLRAAPAGRLPRAVPVGLPRLRRRRGAGGRDVRFRHLRDLLHTTIPPRAVAAMIIEPVQGEGGYIPAPPAFLQVLRAICDEHGILLVADEVQAGSAGPGRCGPSSTPGSSRTSSAWRRRSRTACPLSAIASSKALQERWGRSAHGTTYGGNPVSCAAGIAVLADDPSSATWSRTRRRAGPSCRPASRDRIA